MERVGLAVMLLLLSTFSALACEGRVANPDAFRLETRKPVLGEQVRLVTGFGFRRDLRTHEQVLHGGIDWAAPPGSPVIAAAAGYIAAAQVMGDYGNAVLIDHGGGWQTLYGHLTSLDVRSGDCVAARSLIGTVGSSGHAQGPRLYFEVRQRGTPIDPLSSPVLTNP